MVKQNTSPGVNVGFLCFVCDIELDMTESGLRK